MSQKVRIERVTFAGASVYLGADSCGNPMWSRDPNRIMAWLCDGWRGRFNQFRATRTHRCKEGEGFADVPFGGTGVQPAPSQKDARSLFPWLASLPRNIFQMAQRTENVEWFSALKRKRSIAGWVPGFRSRKHDDWVFSCRHAAGTDSSNADYFKVGRKSGVVVIKGQTRKAHLRPTESKCRWRLVIHVRVSQPIRDYTSVTVNWTNRTLSFVNMPLPIKREPTGAVVGIDMGCAHTMTTSDGAFLDMPQPSEREQRGFLRLQRKLSRQDKAVGGRASKSKRRAKTKARMRSLQGRINRRKDDWVAKITTDLIRGYDLIALEDLNIGGMTKHPTPKPNEKGDGWLPNGASAKAGLNRSILSNRWGDIHRKLEYKAKPAGVELVAVPPQYTSQTCALCGHVAKESRESQAVFRCVACGHEDNADVNAARNILARALSPTGAGSASDVEPPRDVEASTPATASQMQ